MSCMHKHLRWSPSQVNLNISQLLITIRGFTEVYEEIIKEPEGKFHMLKIRTWTT